MIPVCVAVPVMLVSNISDPYFRSIVTDRCIVSENYSACKVATLRSPDCRQRMLPEPYQCKIVWWSTICQLVVVTSVPSVAAGCPRRASSIADSASNNWEPQHEHRSMDL